MNRLEKHLPFLALFLFVLALVPGVFSCVPGWIEYDRVAIAQGQLWRLFSGHWAHFNLDHLAWDGAVFLALGIACERNSRARFLVCVSASALLISAAVWFFLPGLRVYRGLSGIDSALFALLVMDVLREKWQQKEWAWTAAGAFLGAAFFAKIIFEMGTGTTFFVDSTAAGMVPVPLAHLAGLVIGIGAATGRRNCKMKSDVIGTLTASGV